MIQHWRSVTSYTNRLPRSLSAVIVLFSLIFLILSHPAQAIPKSDTRIAVDAQTGEVLTAIRSQVQWHPASLTKMMTLYLLFEALERRTVTMDTRIKLSRRAVGQPPSKLGLAPGETIAVRDAIPALAVKSANDIAVAVAEQLARSESTFARNMTAKARSLGMTRTSFRNASGLHHSQQVTTARDMAILAVALIRDFPQYYKYFSQEEFNFGNRVFRNHNPMLGSYEGMDGLKTGYIYKAGFNLAASVKRNKQRVVAVVLGGDSSRERSQIMKNMLDLAFERLTDPSHKQFTEPLTVRLKQPPPVPSKRPGKHRRPQQTASAEASAGVPIPRRSPPRMADRQEPAILLAHARIARKPQMLTAARATAVTSEAAAASAVIPRPRSRRPQGAFGVQIGAYNSKVEASKHLAKVVKHLPDRLGEPDPIVAQFTDRNRRTFFRAQLTGYETHAAADRTCRWLKNRRTDCIIVALAP